MATGVRMENYNRVRDDAAPLNDPSYEPRCRPTPSGGVPGQILRWGPFSQLRWFRRFSTVLSARTDWKRYHCDSVQHLGPCCGSCADDEEYYGFDAERCCCRAEP